MMKTRVLSIVLLILFLSSACAVAEPGGEPEDLPSPSEEAVPEQPPDDVEPSPSPQPVVDEAPFVWTVAPQFAYEEVSYCYICDSYFHFTDDGGSVLSWETGGIASDEWWRHAHGLVENGWIHDSELDLLGYYAIGDTGPTLRLYPMYEYYERFPQLLWRLYPVRRIDSSKIITTAVTEDYFNYDLSEAFHDDGYAVLHENTFLSKFIYDQYDERFYAAANHIAVSKNGQWGVLDKTGKTIIPFVFDHIVSIDSRTAFAKYEGLYGILDIPATVLAVGKPEYIVLDRSCYPTDMTELCLNRRYGYPSVMKLPASFFEQLRYMTELTSLVLESTGISDVSMLMGLENLKHLNLLGNPIDNSQIAALRAALPDCEILFEMEPAFTDQNGFVWTVSPRHDYDSVYYCSCGQYFYMLPNYEWYYLSPLTGDILGVTGDGHCYDSAVWIYDPKRDLLGYYMSGTSGGNLLLYPTGEFASRFPDHMQRFQLVRSADSTKITINGDAGAGMFYYDATEAFTHDQYAIAFSGVFLSDFIYEIEEIDQRITRTVSAAGFDYIAVCQDGRWGVLDKTGTTVIPFVFEHIVGIDGTTAFAKIDGLYGILDIPATILQSRP